MSATELLVARTWQPDLLVETNSCERSESPSPGLLESMAAGNVEAFEMLYSLYGGIVYAMCKNKLRDEREANEERNRLQPQLEILAIEAASIIRCALDQLDARLKSLLVASFYDALSHEQIAVRFKLPLGTVKSSIRRAISLLRSDLRQQELDKEVCPVRGCASKQTLGLLDAHWGREAELPECALPSRSLVTSWNAKTDGWLLCWRRFRGTWRWILERWSEMWRIAYVWKIWIWLPRCRNFRIAFGWFVLRLAIA